MLEPNAQKVQRSKDATHEHSRNAYLPEPFHNFFIITVVCSILSFIHPQYDKEYHHK